MAEAAVEDRPNQRFYCHMCNVQFENASANFTCPHCANGFIEALESSTISEDIDITDSDDESYQFSINFPAIDLHTPPEDRMPGRARYTVDPPRRRRYASVQPRHRIRPRTLTRLGTTNSRQHTPLEHLIQEFIVNLGVGVNLGGGNTSNMQLFFSNPGDYAWGREGLDAIVTQLLNQMDTTGPPPLSKDVIDSLPTVEISDEQVEQKLQCSVCWEDFLLKELVRQLPCQHVYHEPCIRPWLELHGTCPICRQNLGTPEENPPSDANMSTTNSQNPGNTYATLQQLLQAVQYSGNGSSSSGGPQEPSGDPSNPDSVL